MYYLDHAPPHFHALRGGHEILVAVATLDIIGGSAPAAMRNRVVAWAKSRQSALLECWNRCQNGKKPARLEP